MTSYRKYLYRKYKSDLYYCISVVLTVTYTIYSIMFMAMNGIKIFTWFLFTIPIVILVIIFLNHLASKT